MLQDSDKGRNLLFKCSPDCRDLLIKPVAVLSKGKKEERERERGKILFSFPPIQSKMGQRKGNYSS